MASGCRSTTGALRDGLASLRQVRQSEMCCTSRSVGLVVLYRWTQPRREARPSKKRRFETAGGVMRYDEREPLVAILEAEDLRELMSGRAVSFGHVAQAIRLDPKMNAEKTFEARMLEAIRLYLEQTYR